MTKIKDALDARTLDRPAHPLDLSARLRAGLTLVGLWAMPCTRQVRKLRSEASRPQTRSVKPGTVSGQDGMDGVRTVAVRPP